ncbi:DNA mismatch repair endonuclease MutL [Thalassotalea fusca]
MTIQILPAQLANQIAAGEVVERPASVVKELVENSLDAGATSIKIDIEKGGAKRIRISDNGKGIAKDELTLALSRHATSKIKDLRDLEGISSLGFRGEALASISSVSRLTLTSKPENQEAAWQATAEGRDMQVEVKPAAHPNGTTIDVVDLFFNTPARRKFLRTEKTEFSHIDEVIRRIALARFDVTFTLTHNQKLVRQYRLQADKKHYYKRVAQVCGNSFVENAIEIAVEHDGMNLWGWLGNTRYTRNQNDLCYSYVNGRMMRDKLINHAIRQAYGEHIAAETYPAFVLFLELDYREVDVNVHPAKHEVRFHQGRYVHDFILSVCAKSVVPATQELSTQALAEPLEPEYIAPLRSQAVFASSGANTSYRSETRRDNAIHGSMADANKAYHELMTPKALTPDVIASNSGPSRLSDTVETTHESNVLQSDDVQWLHFVEPHYGLLSLKGNLRIVSLKQLHTDVVMSSIQQQWRGSLTSQPLLIPIRITLTESQKCLYERHAEFWQRMGVVLNSVKGMVYQIREFPALLRETDVLSSLQQIFEYVDRIDANELVNDEPWRMALVSVCVQQKVSKEASLSIWNRWLKLNLNDQVEQLDLKTVEVDLTSTLKQFQ